MAIVGFNFTKISAERKDNNAEKVNISNNVALRDVKEASIHLGSDKQKVLRFVFEFTSAYKPEVGTINFQGNIMYMEDVEKVKKILDGWKKDKKVENDVMTLILNSVLGKCNVQAMILSQEINLPSPIPLPKVQVDNEESKK